jgi:hypothetical protein
MIKVNKKDYKNFLECEKKLWIFFNQKNINLTKEFIKNKQIFLTKDWDIIHEINNDLDLEKYDKFDLFSKNHSQGDNDKEEESYNQWIEEGYKVDQLAKKYYEKEKIYDFEEATQFRDIKNFLKNEEVINVFFQPSFNFQIFSMRCDILKRNKDEFDLIEVKATTKIKKEHLDDLFYQYSILKRNNIKIKDIYLMHLDNEYELKNNQINYQELFKLIDNYEFKVFKQKLSLKDLLLQKEQEIDFENQIFKINKILNQTMTNEERLLWLKKEYCYQNQDDYCLHAINYHENKETIFNLYRISKKEKIDFFYQKKWLFLKDIPESEYKKFLNPKTKKYNWYVQVINLIKNQIYVCHEGKEVLQELLNDYRYPIYMYDFETIAEAIPRFNYSFSYKHLPFQFSIQILKTEEEKNITKSFLVSHLGDPRMEFINKLIEYLFLFGPGTYVAWYKSFEISILDSLILYLKSIPYKDDKELKNYQEWIEKLEIIKANTHDLRDFFKSDLKKRLPFKIYKKEFNGSLSIKSVLPAFSKELSYQNLKIKGGSRASEIFRKFLNQEKLASDFREDLIKYCDQDTYGLIIIFSELKKIIKNWY